MKVLFTDGTEKDVLEANDYDASDWDGWIELIKRKSMDEDDDGYEDTEIIAIFRDEEVRGIIL
jgi:hypothetical protein